MLRLEQLSIVWSITRGLNKVLAGDFKNGNFLSSEPACLWMSARFILCDTVMREALCVKAPRISFHFFGHTHCS